MTKEIVHSMGKLPVKFIRANSTKAWSDRDWRIIINYFRKNSPPKFGMLQSLTEYARKVNKGYISFALDKTTRKRKRRMYFTHV